jgi:regulator of replication initiation timing
VLVAAPHPVDQLMKYKLGELAFDNVMLRAENIALREQLAALLPATPPEPATNGDGPTQPSA